MTEPQSPHEQPIPTLESRMTLSHQVDVFDKVKQLVLIDGWDALTINQTAEYLGTTPAAIEHIIRRHRSEFDDAGYMVLTGAELKRFHSATANLAATVSPFGRARALLPRRAILLVAMLLTESEVAAMIRRYLLDAEQVAVKSVQQPSTDIDLTDPLAVAIFQMQQIQADRARTSELEAKMDVVEAKIEAIEGDFSWFTCLGYAKLHGMRTERSYLAKFGKMATRVMLELHNDVPHKRQDATFGSVNTYPVDVLEEAASRLESAA